MLSATAPVGKNNPFPPHPPSYRPPQEYRDGHAIFCQMQLSEPLCLLPMEKKAWLLNPPAQVWGGPLSEVIRFTEGHCSPKAFFFFNLY